VKYATEISSKTAFQQFAFSFAPILTFMHPIENGCNHPLKSAFEMQISVKNNSLVEKQLFRFITKELFL
jgi:hypothetical protein